MEIIYWPNRDYCQNCSYANYDHGQSDEKTGVIEMFCSHELACSRMYTNTVKEMRDLTFDILEVN